MTPASPARSSSTAPSTTASTSVAVQGRVVEPADLVQAAVLAVPGVARLHAGPLGTAATYLPGRRVAGVALRESGTEVHVVVVLGADIRATAARVHAAVTALGTLAPAPVHVYVEDLAVPT